ncbi:CBS domain-containing protein [Labrys okinawensis]|uniref:CBS domain-containing protein n=1 Tax=Labrys okinawensis TaxID=346911 RepID=UPI0039BD6384
MLVEDVMTKSVLSIDPAASIKDALRLMIAYRISGLPVVDANGGFVGIVTEGDFVRRCEIETQGTGRSWLQDLVARPGKAAQDYIRTRGRTVGEVMTRAVVTIRPDASLAEAADLMTEYKVKRLPVVLDGKLVGIFARSDFMRALERTLPQDGATVGDSEIEAAILAELTHQRWGYQSNIQLGVRDGVVTLGGTVFNADASRAAQVAAENVAGVKSVRNELILIEPLSGAVVVPSQS